MTAQKGNLHKSSIQLPNEVKQYVDGLLETILKDEEQDYASSLVPYSQYKKQKIAQEEKAVQDFYIKLQEAQAVLQSMLATDLWQAWVDGLEKLYAKVQNSSQDINLNETSILELSQVSGDFEIDCYKVGQKLLDEKHYDKARLVFMFLRYIAPKNADYWFCEAVCLQETNDLKGALDAYNRCVALDKNPDALFQIAKILYQLNQFDACIEVLTTVIDAMQHIEVYNDMRKIAINFKTELLARWKKYD
jgi:tetratricopeptide (TPR) repeat protein